jgi:hypothetical protein
VTASRLSPLVRFGLSAFTLALGVGDLAQLGIRSVADQALAFFSRGVNRVWRVVRSVRHA